MIKELRENGDFQTLKESASHIANNREPENNIPFFSNRYTRDNEHSVSYFKNVCKYIGNLDNMEIRNLVTLLKSKHPRQTTFFDGDIMYEVLISNEICHKVCEKQMYRNWNEIISHFSTVF